MQLVSARKPALMGVYESSKTPFALLNIMGKNKARGKIMSQN